MLLAAEDGDGSGMTDRQLRDELLTLLVAGHETTATALAWAVERLAHHPDKLERLAAETRAGEDRYLKAVVLRDPPAATRDLARQPDAAGPDAHSADTSSLPA